MPNRVTRTYTRTYTRRKLFGGRVTRTRTKTKTWVKDKKPTVLRVQVPLTGRDLLEMERLKQEQRAVRAAQREARRQEFQAWWKDAQARQREYAVQRAEHLERFSSPLSSRSVGAVGRLKTCG